MIAATPAMSFPATAPGAALDAEARQIAAGVAKGDEAAFQQLYDCYQRRVFRMAVSLHHGDETAAHEIVQSVMLTAAAKLKPVQSEEHLWNWLAQVARQHSQKIWRQLQRRPEHTTLADIPCPAEIPGTDDALEQSIDTALLALGPDDRQVVEWFYFDGASHKEIAARMDTTPKAVSSRLERARVKLRELLRGRTTDAT
jgi:RNA polymerase sigma-70 factor (ECF subfamily)